MGLSPERLGCTPEVCPSLIVLSMSACSVDADVCQKTQGLDRSNRADKPRRAVCAVRTTDHRVDRAERASGVLCTSIAHDTTIYACRLRHVRVTVTFGGTVLSRSPPLYLNLGHFYYFFISYFFWFLKSKKALKVVKQNFQYENGEKHVYFAKRCPADRTPTAMAKFFILGFV